jgi:hypothetical protein
MDLVMPDPYPRLRHSARCARHDAYSPPKGESPARSNKSLRPAKWSRRSTTLPLPNQLPITAGRVVLLRDLGVRRSDETRSQDQRANKTHLICVPNPALSTNGTSLMAKLQWLTDPWFRLRRVRLLHMAALVLDLVVLQVVALLLIPFFAPVLAPVNRLRVPK